MFMMSDNNFKKKLIQTKLSFSSSISSVSKPSSSSTSLNSVPITSISVADCGLKRKFYEMKKGDGEDDAGPKPYDEKRSKQSSAEKTEEDHMLSAATSNGNPKNADDDHSEDLYGSVGDSDNIDSEDVNGKRTMKYMKQHSFNGGSSDSGHEDDTHQDEDNMPEPRENKYDQQSWRGTPIEEMKRSHKCRSTLAALEKTDDHLVFVKYPFQYKTDALPVAFPSTCQDRWDGHHVRMPFSDQNEYPSEDRNGGMKLTKRWDVIRKALQKDFSGSFELQEAILSYNQRYSNKWKFTAFHYFFNKELSEEEKEQFFGTTLKLLVELAMLLPSLCTKPIPLLKTGRNRKLTFSQQQVACLLANAFFCTFPRRNSRAKGTEYANYPDINFNNLYHCELHSPSLMRKVQKLKCILNYFNRVLTKMPTGLVTFDRKVEKEHDWNRVQETLTNLHVSSTGTIEDAGKGMLQVDFANKYIGGGVLGHGCVQEEIRFLICPEMIVARLFTEALGPLECLIMTGCEQFSRYEGYADTFRWAGNFADCTPRDSWGRLFTEVVAIDALIFRGDYKKQFQRSSLYRELNKAFCGFSTKVIENCRTPVCTGNWGCGAFGGDKQLKSLIQILAASAAKRDVCYFTFDDADLTDSLFEIHKLLLENNREIRGIVSMIEKYGWQLGRNCRQTLFDFIRNAQRSSSFNMNCPERDKDSREGGSNSYYESSQEDLYY